MSRERIIELRSKEQEDSALAPGVKHLEMLGYADGGLEDTYEFRSRVVRAIRQHKPHTILTHDPYRMKSFQHRDHRITGFVTMDAMYPFARDHLHFPEHLEDGQLEPHKAVRLLMWGADSPDVIVDVTDTLEQKIEALSRHASQVQGLAPRGQVGERLRERARLAAAGFPFQYGELFRQLLARG
jgi:LmbE family N-acetylglucosaminyl deacetylase